jgi:hypothetical protein
MNMRGLAAAITALALGAPLAAQAHDTSHAAHAKNDSAFAALQARGKIAMGVDQYTSKHRFESLPDGGRIELQRMEDDSAGTATIREHLQSIADAFVEGDFSTPAYVHWREVPGAAKLAEKRSELRIVYKDLPRGGQLGLWSKDPETVKAIHEFLAFQRGDHRAGE